MYKFTLSKQVDKFLIKHKEISSRFGEILEKLIQNPFENNLQIKKLSGKKNEYRLRIGKYRFLYEIRNKEILIYFYDADSRGDVYKN